MPPFSKLFPFLQRFHFPPFGYPLNPREVGEDVYLVHEIFRADVKHNIRLDQAALSGAGAGIDITFGGPLIPQPPSGFVHAPLLITVSHIPSLVAPAQLWYTQMGSDAAVTSDLAGGNWPLSDLIEVSSLSGFRTSVPLRLPFSRGNFLNVVARVVPVGRTVRAQAFWVTVPIETFDFTTAFSPSGYAARDQQ